KQRRAWYEARIFLARHQERIRLAQKVYDLLQPGGLPALPSLDLGVRFRPAGTAVAGDYYEIIPFSDEKIGIAVADVAGKLEPGLVKLPIFKSALRVAARTSRSPAKLLEETNRVLYPELQPEMFISLSYGLIDLQQMTFSCAVAGQEPPLLIRGADRQIVDIPASGIVLGVMPDASYDEHTAQLSPGDTLVFFTDGVVEIQNRDGEEFGSSRLCQAANAADARDLSAQDLANRLMELVIGFSSPHGRKDDMTILVAKVPSSPGQ
ncbi:MAG: SpoIIE family protein phosphatase, partial [Armatimonadetes bacterium]|nr:SpoIIE family protein phosphatase [Armatimonadota bacterium]NIM22791.1 SpoIIE family protein phosphatase [Armatimonadota bacterium]NIM66658.1 SpoIIE family protein phosphatase [Armatimonadota bacterium]NIM75210.1 SpoIIE family protein phosphatase [Armatimonadota bacterium]NIN04851.1 SpoIIE family protein phosphatase [Armatimonadota bacterium]